MNNERIVSIGINSMIYHKPGCRYVERIKYKNRMAMPKSDARSMQGMRLRLRERDRTEELIIYQNA